MGYQRRVHGDGKTLEEAIKEEAIMEEIFQVTDQINAIHGGSVIGPIEVKIKTWGETGNVVPAAVSKEISSRRKRQAEESRDGKALEEAIKEEAIMEEIFQVTDQINAIHGGSVIGPIEVKIKTWGETGNVVPA